jgi:hypothetical protein
MSVYVTLKNFQICGEATADFGRDGRKFSESPPLQKASNTVLLKHIIQSTFLEVVYNPLRLIADAAAS